MSSDRARVSYDPTRQYRSVLAQQGRVTLEADVNALREVALGGPDTAQRKRLIQHIVRLPVNANTCATALQAARAAWGAAGLTFDAKSMMLTSPAKLLVAPVTPPTPGNVCEP